MGVVNVTPDSFSDGGRFLEAQVAVEHGLKLVEEGADILDIGGESTRPGAAPVSEGEELRRVMPVIEALKTKVNVPVSIDTMKPAVARAALEAGASIVNDVGANRTDMEMWRVTAAAGAGYICMHMQGTPRTMQANPSYGNVVEEVAQFFSERIQRMSDCGIGLAQVILDPGIGFGKTLEHNLELLAGLRRFSRFERPVAIGVSRKSFLERLLPESQRSEARGERSEARGQRSEVNTFENRLPGALACACLAVEAGVQIIRTHDVPETVRAIRTAEAIIAPRSKRS
ncbi:MAG: dihydropteroate synthase [Verrucomicrobia bacterium]|nr:MAG: dihydropteroate synthase [Verrucomicrobiota bacterium]